MKFIDAMSLKTVNRVLYFGTSEIQNDGWSIRIFW